METLLETSSWTGVPAMGLSPFFNVYCTCPSTVVVCFPPCGGSVLIVGSFVTSAVTVILLH